LVVADAADAGRSAKRFTDAEFRRIQKSSFFVGAVAFWRQVERLAGPESRTRLHAQGVLAEMARQSLEDCAGLAYSPQHAECLAYCGFPPAGMRLPGSSALETG
jgi:hypothetical protein